MSQGTLGDGVEDTLDTLVIAPAVAKCAHGIKGGGERYVQPIRR